MPQWLAQLLQADLLRGSFIPPKLQRELRDLTRHRAQLVAEHTRVVNRIHKTLEDANIKLSSVAADILGASGREMIEALIHGIEDPEALSDLARGRLREKIPQLKLALEGCLNDHHRFLLRFLMGHISDIETQIEEFDTRIEQLMRPFQEEADRIKELPGFSQRAAENLLSEIGVDMSRFPTGGHLCSWVGICPSNNESAGKRKSGKTSKGNRWVRQIMVQAAWAATRKKTSYFQAQYRRLAKRRGKKRALLAVGHSQLVVIHHMLKRHTTYRELGADCFDRLNPEKTARYHVRRLETLGFQATIHSPKKAA